MRDFIRQSATVGINFDGPLSALFNEEDLSYTRVEANRTPFLLVQVLVYLSCALCNYRHIESRLEQVKVPDERDKCRAAQEIARNGEFCG